MPTITAGAILNDAKAILMDTTGVRWSDAELLGWLSAGQRETVALRPDTASKSVAHTLATGSKQTIPTDGHCFLDVPHTSAGGAVRKVPKQLMDATLPNWRAATASSAPKHYVYDPRLPKVFYVYPPASAGTVVELVYAVVPAAIASTATVISIDDVYANALVDYVLYRAYSKDLELVGNADRAAMHRQAYENTLGLKAQSDSVSVSQDSVKG